MEHYKQENYHYFDSHGWVVRERKTGEVGEVIGHTVFSGILDEANFKQSDHWDNY